MVNTKGRLAKIFSIVTVGLFFVIVMKNSFETVPAARVKVATLLGRIKTHFLKVFILQIHYMLFILMTFV